MLFNKKDAYVINRGPILLGGGWAAPLCPSQLHSQGLHEHLPLPLSRTESDSRGLGWPERCPSFTAARGIGTAWERAGRKSPCRCACTQEPFSGRRGCLILCAD